jgi:hypothetical protein
MPTAGGFVGLALMGEQVLRSANINFIDFCLGHSSLPSRCAGAMR